MNERFNDFCKGFSIFMICTESPFLEFIETKPISAIPIRNGKLECNFLEYKIPPAQVRKPNA